MIVFAPAENNLSFRCPSPAEINFDVELKEIEVVLSEASSQDVELDDALLRRSTGATTRIDAEVSYLPIVGSVVLPRFSSANSSLATVDSQGIVTSVGTGQVDIFCRALQTTKRVTHNARTLTPTTTDTFVDYLPGSLGKAAASSLDSIIAGGGELTLFSAKSQPAGTFERNTACWAGSLDWTGVSPTNSADAFRRGGTLVSPRHLIWANHFNIPNGTQIIFVSNNNTTVTRTVANSSPIPNTDIQVGVLNEDVEEGVSFYAVMPSTWREYLATVFQTFLPLVTTDQEQKALCRELTTITEASDFIAHRRAQQAERQALSEQIVVGDSGQPLFLVLNGQMILLGCHYSAWGATNIASNITAINAAMTTLGGGYQLTTADLSSFTNFAS